MKKYLSLLLAGTMALGCTACGNNEESESFDPDEFYPLTKSEFDDYYESDYVRFPISSSWEISDESAVDAHDYIKYELPHCVELEFEITDPTLKDLDEYPDETVIYFNDQDSESSFFKCTQITNGYKYEFTAHKGDFSSRDSVKLIINYIFDNLEFSDIQQPNPTEAPTPKPTEPPTPKPTSSPTTVVPTTEAPTEPEPTTPPEPTKSFEETFKEGCEIIDYKDIARDQDGLSGKDVVITGEIIQVIGDGAFMISTGQTSYGSYFDDNMLVYYDIGEGDRLLEDDIVTFYGTLTGLYTYETVLGAEKTVPSMLGMYVDLN